MLGTIAHSHIIAPLGAVSTGTQHVCRNSVNATRCINQDVLLHHLLHGLIVAHFFPVHPGDGFDLGDVAAVGLLQRCRHLADTCPGARRVDRRREPGVALREHRLRRVGVGDLAVSGVGRERARGAGVGAGVGAAACEVAGWAD